MKARTKQLTANALFTAMAFIIMFVIHFPVNSFLTYDPKNVIITIAGLIFGPLSALIISLTVAFLEMVTVSDTGFIGLIMNFLATASFSCVVAIIYRTKKSAATLWLGLLCATLTMTGVMIFWNYLITPLYLEISREAVKGMIMPLLLPFNLIKNFINAAAILVLFRPVESALIKTDIIKYNRSASIGKSYIASGIIGLVLLISGIILIFAFRSNLA